MEKTTKYLRCHTASYKYSVGDRFEVTDEDNRCYYVAELSGGYAKLPDSDGLSYVTWFTLETDAEIAEVTAPITVLPDESLGGVSREYREVKRKASVGERIKVTDDTCDQYTAGKVYEVREDDGDVIRIDSYNGGTVYMDKDEYVVLEPSDILRINSERFRMVDRKAAVGERVIVTKVRAGYGIFSAGNVGIAQEEAGLFDFNGQGNVNYNDGDGVWYVGPHNGNSAYAVLEPLTSAELAPTPTPLSELPLVDQYAENITVLTRKIAQLEKRNTALESRILALETDSSPSYVKVASGPVDNTLPSYAKSAQQIRDEIVKRAKADVERIIDECWAAVRVG